jgi:hypothetical protein
MLGKPYSDSDFVPFCNVQDLDPDRLSVRLQHLIKVERPLQLVLPLVLEPIFFVASRHEYFPFDNLRVLSHATCHDRPRS